MIKYKQIDGWMLFGYTSTGESVTEAILLLAMLHIFVNNTLLIKFQSYITYEYYAIYYSA